MRHDRIYKALPLEDFIDQSSFTFAHGGVYLGGVISDFNYIRTLPRMAEMSDAELKTEFMQNVIKALESCQEVNIQVDDYGKYYDVWYDWCDTPEDSCISEESKEQHSGDIFVIGKITSDEKEKMSLEDFLVWSLSGAKQAYECNLPENSLAWDSLSDEDKMGLVAHEININANDYYIASDTHVRNRDEAKAVIVPQDDQEYYRCPSCGNNLGFSDDYFGDVTEIRKNGRYCEKCGQKLCV